jgi:antitoxin ParD1/3/4
MEIAIPKSLEALVRRKVEEGHYSTEEEVVADALRLMQVRDDVVAMKRDRLRDALDRGYEDVAAGRVIQLETEDEIDALFASLCSDSSSPRSPGRISLRFVATPLGRGGGTGRPSTWTSFATR